jgi:hypothetical protein
LHVVVVVGRRVAVSNLAMVKTLRQCAAELRVTLRQQRPGAQA